MEEVETYPDVESNFPIPTMDSVLIDTLCSELEVEEIDESILNDIELHLECDDDGNSYSLPKPKIAQTTLVCDVNIQISSLEKGNVNEKQGCGFQCYICREFFSMESKYRHHMSRSHQIDRPFHCRFCEYSSTCKKLLVKHSKRKHEFTKVIKNLLKTDSSRKYYWTGTKQNGNTTGTCALNNTSKNTLSDNESIKNADNNMNEIERLNSSQGLDNIDQVFFCCKCPYQTTTKPLLTAHMNAKHAPDRKKYSCNMCNFICKQKRTLDAHTKKHEGDSSYQCDTCNKTFYTNTALKRHLITHNLDRPYACTHENCMKSFKIQGALTDHLKKVHLGKHATKSSKLVKNENKPASPRTISGLSKTSDNQIKCSESKLCISKEAPVDCGSQFKCTWKDCKKSFRDNFNLNVHMATHTGKKKRNCSYCTFTSIQKTSLDWHVKKKHVDLLTT